MLQAVLIVYIGWTLLGSWSCTNSRRQETESPSFPYLTLHTHTRQNCSDLFTLNFITAKPSLWTIRVLQLPMICLYTQLLHIQDLLFGVQQPLFTSFKMFSLQMCEMSSRKLKTCGHQIKTSSFWTFICVMHKRWQQTNKDRSNAVDIFAINLHII